MKQDTLGTMAFMAKQESLDDDVIEYRREMEPQVVKALYSTAEQAKLHTHYHNKNFYIVILWSVERLTQSPQWRIFARLSCPTPVYKQSVWKYHRSSNSLEFLWTIPDAILYHYILRTPSEMNKENKELYSFVQAMESGDLLEWIKKENGEKVDAVIKIDPMLSELVHE